MRAWMRARMDACVHAGVHVCIYNYVCMGSMIFGHTAFGHIIVSLLICGCVIIDLWLQVGSRSRKK